MEIHSVSLFAATIAPGLQLANLPPSAADAARFAEMVGVTTVPPAASAAPAANVAQAASASTAPAIAPSAPLAGPSASDATAPIPTLGEAVLQGMEKMRTQFDQNWTEIAAMANGGDGKLASAADLLRFQLKAVETSFQYSLVSKLVSKSEQNVEQLVKMQ